MQNTQTRSQKTKAVQKSSSRSVVAAGKPEMVDAPVRVNRPAAMTAQEREMLVARVAYFRAEKRGFAPGAELQDWFEAEAEVQRLIGGA